MNAILSLLDDGEILPLLFVVLLLNCFGSRLADEKNRRIAAGLASLAFLAYLGVRLLSRVPWGSEEFLDLIIRGLLGGGIVFGLALFVLPLLAAFYERLLLTPYQSVRHRLQALRQRLRTRREFSRSSPSVPSPSPEELERQARDVRECDAAERRRADVRASAEIFFALHRPEIEPRFSEAMLQDYLKRHMSGEFPPEYVEERGRQLLDTLQRHLDKVVPPLHAMSFDDLLKSFDDRMRRIRESPLDERDKDILLFQLDEERELAVRKAIREGRL